MYKTRIILTNMCMVYDGDRILIQNRVKKDWPGINFPGGHVKYNESLEESCIREMKEETGLDLYDLEFVGVFEWNIKETRTRHLATLYKTNKFKGEIKSSKEGEIFWINKQDVNKYDQSVDFDKILELMEK